MIRRTICLLVAIAVALVVGCSRQPQYHIGEWESKIQPVGRKMWKETYYFSEDGKVQYILLFLGEAPGVVEGSYKIDYSKNPIHLDITFYGHDIRLGIVRFIGEDRSSIQMVLASEGKERPINFESGSNPFWLTKKVKK